MKNSNRQRILRRLKIISGQVRGLEKMVEDEKYCVDVIYQSLAVKEALSGVEDLILENHLTIHLAEQMSSSKQARAIKEMLSIYRLSKKK